MCVCVCVCVCVSMGVCSWSSRVHISQSTMECLRGEFEVEPGNGGERCDYLKERGLHTYLVLVPPKGPAAKNGINGVVREPPPKARTTEELPSPL